jgi:excinuclease UvrABC ATPase subunit
MELKVCPETSITNYLSMYSVSHPKKRRPHLHHGGTLKSLTKPNLTEVTLNIATDVLVMVTPLYVEDWSKVCFTHLEQSTRQEALRVEIR